MSWHFPAFYDPRFRWVLAGQACRRTNAQLPHADLVLFRLTEDYLDRPHGTAGNLLRDDRDCLARRRLVAVGLETEPPWNTAADESRWWHDDLSVSASSVAACYSSPARACLVVVVFADRHSFDAVFAAFRPCTFSRRSTCADRCRHSDAGA